MTERGPDFSRARRNKNRKRSSTILNIMIGVVVVLIIIVASTIFLGNDDDGNVATEELFATDGTDKSSEDIESEVIEDEATIEEDKDEAEEDESLSSGSEKPAETEETPSEPEVEIKEEDKSVGSVTFVTSDDDIVAETIISAAWQPIGTTQSGEHASQYDRESVDWAEKQQALAYATGLSQNAMIFWKIKNGGGPQKSVGIVSSTDKAEKYRVYLEWVDGEGWKPVKMDVLKTLDFEY
ncbi:YrrS family protein [Sporosarcina sp. YIM B06819]|uniref:YrrS family protein n=1 Tax=Sporosarcina sp. YIM B06819 TaxID=3081769 RepID=UPI00298C05F9|nr:YrrS family protein [Sporosarcina sp. YIM B06819]